MLTAVFRRMDHAGRVLLRPSWNWLFLGLVGLLAIAAFLRDEFLSPESAARYKLLKMLPNLPPFAWLSIILFALMGVMFEASFRNSEEKDKRIEALERPGSHENTEHNALEITCGDSDAFVRTENLIAGQTRAVAYLKIRNIGNGFLSEVRAGIVGCEPPIYTGAGSSFTYFSLGESFSLARGQHKFLAVCFWNIGWQGNTTAETVVNFPIISGTYAGGRPHILLPQEASPALMTIECEALECRAARKQFRLYARDRKLFLRTG